jgi:hypothetical protein
LRIDITLQVGSVQQEVNVTANAVQVETASTQLGDVIESKKMLSLPLNGRSYIDLLGLQAGVAPDTAGTIGGDRPVLVKSSLRTRTTRARMALILTFCRMRLPAQPWERFGTANRRFFHGPGIMNTDFGMSKRTAIRESMAFEIRAEFFNIFNHNAVRQSTRQLQQQPVRRSYQRTRSAHRSDQRQVLLVRAPVREDGMSCTPFHLRYSA